MLTGIGVVIIVTGGILYVRGQSAPDTMLPPGTQPTPTYSYSLDASPAGEPRYVTYSKASFDAAKGKKRVFFFHATWCPTCKTANEEITGRPDGIPEDVVLFKTDYDKETALKRQYGITYQHTFVLVDENGKELKKWNGGGLAELAANTQ